jgi:hypothetical protein
MADLRRGGLDRQELVKVVRQVRSRWRTKLLLRGGFILVGGGLLALILASWGLHAAKFSPAAVLGFRVGIFTVFAALAIGWLVKPLRREVTDMQVALYIEEHDPSRPSTSARRSMAAGPWASAQFSAMPRRSRPWPASRSFSSSSGRTSSGRARRRC